MKKRSQNNDNRATRQLTVTELGAVHGGVSMRRELIVDGTAVLKGNVDMDPA